MKRAIDVAAIAWSWGVVSFHVCFNGVLLTVVGAAGDQLEPSEKMLHELRDIRDSMSSMLLATAAYVLNETRHKS